MIPRDTSIVFNGWNAAHRPPEPGANAPSLDEAKALAERYG